MATKHRSALLLLIVSLFAAGQSFRISSFDQSSTDSVLTDAYGQRTNSIGDNVCARTCNQLYSQVAFQPGKTYIYNVDLETRIGAGADDQESQHVKISAHADVSAYSQCELVLKLRKVHVAGIPNHQQLAQQLEQKPIHFAYEDGKVVDVCASPVEEKWIVDVKKSIISALQMSSTDVSQRQTVIETDISGQCETIYEPLQHDSEVTIIRKVKQMNKCGHRHQFNVALFPRSYGLDQVVRSSIPTISSNATNECTQVIKNQIVESVTCVDSQRVRALGVQVLARIEIQLLEKKPTLLVQRLEKGFAKHRLTMSQNSVDWHKINSQSHREGEDRRYSIHEVQQLLKQICGKVLTSVQLDVPVMFHDLVHGVHSLSNPQEPAQLWEQVRSGELCASKKLLDIFLDASALAGNEGSVEVLIRAYQQKQISQARANYLFGLLSFAKQPSVEAAERLVQFVVQQQPQLVQLPRGIIFGVTGFVHNLQIVQAQTQHQNPKVDQVVQTIVQTLLQAVQQLLPQVSSQQQEHEALTLVYALKNLVLVPDVPHRQQLDLPSIQIAQQLVQLLQKNPRTQYSQEIRVAIVKTLVNAGIDDQIRQYLLEQLVQNAQEGIEIQIEAYKAVVLSGATTVQLEQIKHYTEQVESSPKQQDLVNYIRSHQANLRTTSDPHKQTILPANAPIFSKPSGQWFGISRNYELSYVNAYSNIGVTAETDVIYDSAHGKHQFAPVPQTVAFNLTVPLGNSELQLVEVRIHQHGLEQVIAQHLATIDPRSFANDPWRVAKETVQYLLKNGASALERNPQVHVLLQIIVDGKTVVLIDEQDIIHDDIDGAPYAEDLLASLEKIVIDRAFAITPIDSHVQFPTVNGIPVQFRVNSTVVLGMKADISFVESENKEGMKLKYAVYPSVASQLETAVEFHFGPQTKSIEYVQNFYSAPQVDLLFEFNKGRSSLKLNVPEDKYILARYESVVYVRNNQGQRVRLNDKKALREQALLLTGDQVHICSNVTRKVLGMVLCYDFSVIETPHALDVISELSVVKTDPKLRYYEVSFEIPAKYYDKLRRKSDVVPLESIDTEVTKFVFNTPGSEVDREIVFEVEFPDFNPATGPLNARLRVQTPWKQVLALVSVRKDDPKERLINVEVSVDDQKFVEMELALGLIRRGQKTEYRPRLRLSSDSLLQSPVQLAGVMTYSRGRKTLLHFQLDDVTAQRQYIKGTWIRERGDRNSALAARTSADMLISLLGLNAKFAGTFELADKLVKLDLSSDYQLPSWEQKQQAKIAFKVQNLSSGKILKLVNFGVVKLSQFPKYQVRYSQNVMYASGEQFEHDLKLGWAADDDEQIRLYQAIRKTGQRGKIDIESQSIVVFRPQEINYEVKATAALVGFGINGQKRYTIAINGAARDQPQSESNFQSEIAYSHLSKSPLKMKLRASLKTSDNEWMVSDEIEEQTPGKYQGHLILQLAPEQKFSLNYVYLIKGVTEADRRDSPLAEHELTIDCRNSQSKSTARHHGLLRMEQDRSWLVRSKLTTDDAGEIYDGELKYSKPEGKTNFYFTHVPRDIRAKLAVQAITVSSPANGQWELSTPTLKHESQFELVPTQSWFFNSKTKRNDENLLSIESKQDKRTRHQRFAISSNPVDAEFQFDLPEDHEQKAQIRVDMPSSWSHLTSFTRHAKKPFISLDSRTKYSGSNIADLSAKYDPEDQHYFKLNTPLARTDLNCELEPSKQSIRKAELNLEAGKYFHLSKFAIEPRDQSVDFESLTKKSGTPLANLRYQLSGDNIHTISVDSPQLLTASAECNLARNSRKPYASIDVKLTDRKTGKQVQHQTKLTAERDSQYDDQSQWNSLGSISLESNTLKQNQNVAQIEANLAKLQSKQKSFAKIRIGDHLESKIELEPYKSARIKVDCPDYDHLTELTYQPSEEVSGKGDWKVQSSTVALKNKRQRYSFDAEHLRQKRSAFKIDVPQFDSDMSYEHPEGDLSNHKMNFVFNGKSIMKSPVSHKTQMTWLARQRSQPTVRLESRTTRKARQTGYEDNILDIDAAYHHNQPQLPSSLKLKLGKTLSGDLNVSVFSPNVKTVALSGELNDKRSGRVYRHQSEARFQPQLTRFSMDSNTDRDGQVLAKLDTVLTANPDEKSYFNINGGIRTPFKAQFELEPRNRRALLDFDVAPYQHRTEFAKDGAYKLKTVTTRAQQNVFNLDGLLSPSHEISHLKIKAGSPNTANEYHSEIVVHPTKKYGQIVLQSKNLKHDSLFKFDDEDESMQKQGRSAFFKTNTVYQGKVLADVNARLRGLRGENKIEAELPQFSFKSIIDVPTKQGSIDLRNRHTGRHLLGSVAVNQQLDADKSFHFDFAWDVERDPASKVLVDLLVKRVPSQRGSFLTKVDDLVVVFTAQYATSKLVLNSELVPEAVFQNPIRISLGYLPLDQARVSESWQLIYTHTMQDPTQYQCKWDFIVGEQLKYGLQLNGQVTEEKFEFGAKTLAPSKPALQVTFNLAAGTRVPGQQYFLEATAVHAESNRYQVVFDLTKHLETRKLDGKLELRFPNMELHVVSFTADLVHKLYKLDVINEQTGKQVDMEASYADNLVHLNAISNIPFFPKVDAKIRYIPGEELHAKLDLDAERKFEMTAKYTGELSTLQFYVLTKVDSVYTPSVEFVAEGRKSPEDGNTQRLVSISGKYNMVEVLNGQFRQQDVQQWTAEGSVASIRSGEKLVESSIQSTPIDGHSNSYQVKLLPQANNYVEPFVATIREQRPTSANGYIRSIKIDLTEVQSQKLASTVEVLIKHQKWTELPEMFEVTMEHKPSNSRGWFRLSIREQIEAQQQKESFEQSLFDTVEQTNGVTSKRAIRRVRDQAVIGWNQKSAGFALTTIQYGAEKALEHELKIFSPTGLSGRILQVRCAHQMTRDMFFIKQQLRTDVARQREPIYQYAVLVQRDQQAGITGKVQLESFKFVRSPKLVEFTIQPYTESKPVDVKLRIDVGRTEKDAITVRTVVQHQRAHQITGYFGTPSQNHTLHFSAKSQDRSVMDFELDAHVSESSIGMVWQNLNRKGQQQQGQYLVRFFGEDRFEAVLANPGHKYHVNGIYKRKTGAEGPLVMDFVVAKYIAKRQSWNSKTAEPVLISEHKVHLESVGKCIRADIEDAQSQDDTTRQVSICADLNRANLVNIAVDSIRNGQKSVEFNARLDARSVAKALKLSLHWNPEYSRQLLATLLQLNQQNQETLSEKITQHELIQELVHKYTVVLQRLAQDFAYEPLVKILAEEILPIVEEFGLTREVLRKWCAIIMEPLERMLEVIRVNLTESFEQFERAYAEWVSQAQQTCARSKSCTKASELIAALQSSEELSRLVAEPLVAMLQKTHRFVAHSQGKLIRNLPTINWEQFVPEPVQDFVRTTLETIYVTVRQTLVDPQGPFSGLLFRLETIGQELFGTAQFRSVRWERVREAVQESVRLLFSPSAWSSSVRVLIWDPQNGQVQMEIKSPAIGGLNSSTVIETPDIESRPSPKSSWIFSRGPNSTEPKAKITAGPSYTHGINSYDRYASPVSRYLN